MKSEKLVRCRQMEHPDVAHVEPCPDLKILNAFYDCELDAMNAHSIEEHVLKCRVCNETLESMRLVTRKLGGPKVRAAPSNALGEQILRDVQVLASGKKPRLLLRRSRALGASAAGALIAAGIAALAVLPGMQTPRDLMPLKDQFVQNHIRSLMVDHIFDVVSSDNHVLKPWFNGKIDFAPPVPNLEHAGFPLVGARLDIVSKQPAAVLVFTRRLHKINVFIWPGEKIPDSSASDGYNIASWRHADMGFVAVSDLNNQELRQFALLFQQAIQ